MARKREKKGSDEPGVPGWVVTYGDMMSLLLTFFILLLSFSTISQKDFKEAMMSLQGAFGIFSQFEHIINPMPRPPKKSSKQSEKTARQLQRMLQIQGKDKDVKIEYANDGDLRIVLPNQFLFESASADLKSEADAMLASVGEVLADIPSGFINVLGHTDNRPLASSSQYRDNWDLSYGRAYSVVKQLSVGSNIAMDRFEIVACGPSQPIATNDTEEGRQANRRVEILVRGLQDSATVDELQGRIDQIQGLGTQDVTPQPETGNRTP